MKAMLFTMILGCILRTGMAQNVNVLLTDIREERRLNQKDSYLELSLKVNGLVIDDDRKVRISTVVKATDNLGNALKQVTGSFDGDFTGYNDMRLKLEAPARNATHLTEIVATLEYFVPTKENKGIVEISKPLEKYNTNLLKAHKNAPTIILIDEAGMKKLKEENEAAYNKEMEKFKKENPEAEKMGDLVGGLKGFFESLFDFGAYGPTVTFLINDPEEKILGITVYDDKGEKMNNGWSSSGNQRTISLSAVPQNNWKIELLMKNAASVKEHTVKLGQVFLP